LPVAAAAPKTAAAPAAPAAVVPEIAKYGAHARIPAGSPPPSGHEPPKTPEARPEWAVEADIAERVNATALLDMGANPLNAVIMGLQSMPAGTVMYMDVPFYPAPMVDALRAKGHGVWGEEIDDGWAMWIRK
jgi:hypothetical protein